MSRRRDVDPYLRHMRDAAREIREFTADGEEAFRASRLIQAAVIRNLEVLGEAAKHVPGEYRAAHPELPWQAMAGMRDLLIHAYHRVDVDVVWETVAGPIPTLIEHLDGLLEDER